MSQPTLLAVSNQLADAVAVAAPSVVQVHGRRRPASGIVYADDVVLTTIRAVGREEGLRVRTSDGRTIDAEVAGWGGMGLAVLRAPGLNAPPAVVAKTPARVGHLGLAIARSWSNSVTASFGVVSVIGGPLAIGRGQSIIEIIRTTAPMHDGFAGGAFVDAEGHVLGLTTAAEIRGLGVVIPAPIAWAAAASLLEHGRLKRGYLGIAGQPVVMSKLGEDATSDRVVLVAGVTAGSPADVAGVIVGDVLLAFDGQSIESPEALMDLLVGDRVGKTTTLRVLRGGSPLELTVTVGERR
jgi:S1-C subfamily serine protease